MRGRGRVRVGPAPGRRLICSNVPIGSLVERGPLAAGENCLLEPRVGGDTEHGTLTLLSVAAAADHRVFHGQHDNRYRAKNSLVTSKQWTRCKKEDHNLCETVKKDEPQNLWDRLLFVEGQKGRPT